MWILYYASWGVVRKSRDRKQLPFFEWKKWPLDSIGGFFSPFRTSVFVLWFPYFGFRAFSTCPWLVLVSSPAGIIYYVYMDWKWLRILSQEFWSWKFWSAGPKFSLENMVRLCNNWSGLKTLVLRLLFWKEHNTTNSSTKGSLGNSQRTWRSRKLFAVAGRVSHAIVLIKDTSHIRMN